MKKKKVLICGVTGFIGRNVAERLLPREDMELFGSYFNSEPWSDPRIKMIKADLTRKEDVEKAVQGMDVIIQASATVAGAKEIFEKPYNNVTDNAVMNSLIFRAAHAAGVKHVIVFSCTIMYQPSEAPLKESDFDISQDPVKIYFGAGWTKVYTEKMAEFSSRLGDTKYTAIRHSNIYGPYDKYGLVGSHVFGATVTKVMTSTDGKIVVWGSGEEERDLLYVSDLMDFIELALDKQKEKFALYNVGYGSSISVKDLVQKIIHHSGRELKMEFDLSKPTIKTKLALDCTKAREELGWVRKVSLDDGIKMTLDWYKKAPNLR